MNYIGSRSGFMVRVKMDDWRLSLLSLAGITICCWAGIHRDSISLSSGGNIYIHLLVPMGPTYLKLPTACYFGGTRAAIFFSDPGFMIRSKRRYVVRIHASSGRERMNESTKVSLIRRLVSMYRGSDAAGLQWQNWPHNRMGEFHSLIRAGQHESEQIVGIVVPLNPIRFSMTILLSLLGP